MSTREPKDRYIPCPGSIGVIGIDCHPPTVFLLRRTCRNGAMFARCSICRTRIFSNDPKWKKAGYTAEELRRMVPGCVDGEGAPLT